MPFATNADLSDSVRRRFSGRCQTVWREAWNSAHDSGKNEASAFAIAEAAAKDCMAATMEKVDLTVNIAKADTPRQIAYGVVLEPRDDTNPDTQGDYYDADEVEKAAHGFMAHVSEGVGFSDPMHDGKTRIGYPVESYIAPVDFYLGDQFVHKGSWVMGMRYPDPEVWARIADGTFAAFSVGGRGIRE